MPTPSTVDTRHASSGGTFRRPHFVRFVFLTGLFVGTLDAIAAVLDLVLTYHGDPNIAFQYIASGIFGQRALGGGVSMTLWGILFHYTFALSWTALFFLLRPKVEFLKRPWHVVGPVFAFIVWISMNLVIRPLSAVPHIPWTVFKIVKSALILVVTIGSPISFAASRFFATESRQSEHRS